MVTSSVCSGQVFAVARTWKITHDELKAIQNTLTETGNCFVSPTGKKIDDDNSYWNESVLSQREKRTSSLYNAIPW